MSDVIPLRRWDDGADGGITHAQRHIAVENRLTALEHRDLYITALLMINTMLTAGDVVTKLGPIIKAFSAVVHIP